ncbi:hypothetical protein R3W88_006118 [Solanum pinnatisectum]|uniref:Uncharacterized protein n=1 Tax=Solanum pinnatisectum TaxID=50273 RepID=A0AAV9KGQ3_9SOLN|nr:hypothetical protein R3W88_006118 [Solanum pinnatisectum]
MDWPEFLESSNPQEPTIDLYGVSPQDNHEVTTQTDRWTPEEKQVFENAFSRYNNLGSQTFFEFIASKFPHKSMEEMKNLYINLFKEVEMENSSKNKNVFIGDVVDDHHQQHHQVPQEDNSSDKEANLNDTPPRVEISRSRRHRRGIPWTEGEHSLFLMGLNKFGKGDWKSISRHYVVSKTPTQVASHAQKYFSRRTSKTPVDRRRPSINDIQTVTLNSRRTTITTTVTTIPQINNNILAYNNNYQVGSSSRPFHYSNYTFGGEASGSNSSVMEQNNNNLHRPVSPRPFLSMYFSSTRGITPKSK